MAASAGPSGHVLKILIPLPHSITQLTQAPFVSFVSAPVGDVLKSRPVWRTTPPMASPQSAGTSVVRRLPVSILSVSASQPRAGQHVQGIANRPRSLSLTHSLRVHVAGCEVSRQGACAGLGDDCAGRLDGRPPAAAVKPARAWLEILGQRTRARTMKGNRAGAAIPDTCSAGNAEPDRIELRQVTLPALGLGRLPPWLELVAPLAECLARILRQPQEPVIPRNAPVGSGLSRSAQCFGGQRVQPVEHMPRLTLGPAGLGNRSTSASHGLSGQEIRNRSIIPSSISAPPGAIQTGQRPRLDSIMIDSRASSIVTVRARCGRRCTGRRSQPAGRGPRRGLFLPSQLLQQPLRPSRTDSTPSGVCHEDFAQLLRSDR